MARRLGPEGVHVSYLTIDAVIDVPWTREAYAGKPDEFYARPDDLADLDLSRFVAATGQSGNPLSRHYRDLTALWATGQGVAIDRTAGSDRENAVGVLRLHPSQR